MESIKQGKTESEDDMRNEIIKSDAQITHINNENYDVFSANKQFVERVKTASDADFEKKLQTMPKDMQTFLRIVRERRKE